MVSSSLIIQNIRIFDGENEIVKGSVLVENGIIQRVSDQEINPPHSSTVLISKPGHTLMPGLIDGHIHADEGNGIALTQSLSFGVTTVCDMHQEREHVLPLRNLAGESAAAADYKTCSEAATIPEGWPAAVVTAFDKSEETLKKVSAWPKLKTKEDVTCYLNDRVDDKVDYIKLMHEDGAGLIVKPEIPSLVLQREVIKAAHERGLTTVAHALSLQGTLDILAAGVDGLTHTFIDKPPTKELIDAYKKNNAHCNPTLAGIGSLTKQGQKDQESYANDHRIKHLLPEDGKNRLLNCLALANEDSDVEYAYQTVRELKKAGIDIILGSDSAKPAFGTAFGLTAHHELSLLVRKCGFTPREALAAGTSVVAKRLKFLDRGRIQEGLRADLVLVEGNPLEDIDCTLNLRGVWKKGVICPTYQSIQG